ncbi:uncharacterized protein aunip [Gadus morhua]|nr:uncharacterized protein LOC115535644 [Gadus morhua]
MKSSRPAPQEQCGVWLDPVELKSKVKKKQPFRPISNLLNPLAGGDRYSLAVALNFTQTKIEMPNVKQSSISSFFTAQRRVLKKMSSSEDLHIYQTSSSISNRDSSISTTGAPGTKRKHEVVDRIPDVKSQAKAACTDVDRTGPGHQWMGQSGQKTDPKDTARHEYNSTLPWDNQCREQEAEELLSQPKRMKLHPETFSVYTVGVDPHIDELSQKPLSQFCSSQNIQKQINRIENKIPDFLPPVSQRDFALSNEERPTPGRCRDTGADIPESLTQSESGFGDVLGSAGRTSTQKPFEHTNASQINEENDQYRLTCSQTQYEPQVPATPKPLDTCTEPKSNPLKHRETDQVRATAEEHDIFPERASLKPKDSLGNKYRVPDPLPNNLHGNTIDLLFTQDSEGLRVIAHRGPRAPRNPLKDHTNLGLTWEQGTGAQKYEVYEEEEEMLFTQDSQGNMVIKH